MKKVVANDKEKTEEQYEEKITNTINAVKLGVNPERLDLVKEVERRMIREQRRLSENIIERA